MSNFVRRWVLTDPYDTDPTTNTYHFPRNPTEMTSLHADRAITSQTTTNRRILLYEGQTPAKQWTFTGPLMHKSDYDDLRHWVYGNTATGAVNHGKRRLILTDHFARNISLVFVSLDAVPKRRTGYYYSHDYTVTALVLGVSDPVILDSGPTSADVNTLDVFPGTGL